MRITDLEIDGYGVWSSLRIEKLSDALSVLYGPNEAGKSTLLQFIRSMLYGFSPSRRCYFPPLHGGRPGGTLDLAGPHGRFHIARYDSAADGGPGEQLTLTAPDGTRQGEHFIKVLLSNVDEQVFNNVFAVGLREIQELATLSDTEAAELLYNLTAGLDRVSLVEVLHELDNSRNRLLDAAGGPCQLTQLLAEREKLCAEIEELGAANRRYGHLVAEREQLHAEVTRLEEEANRTERLIAVVDLAAALRERWAQRAALDEQLSALGPLKTVPEGAIERLDGCNHRLQKHQQQLDQLAQLREAARREFAALPINEPLWRQAARIEAFQEQEPWITQLQAQISQLQTEIGQLEGELAAEGQRLGFTAAMTALPAFSARRLARYGLSQNRWANAGSNGPRQNRPRRLPRRPYNRLRGRSRPRSRPMAKPTWQPRWTAPEAWFRSFAAARKPTIDGINWPAIKSIWKIAAGACWAVNCCRPVCLSGSAWRSSWEWCSSWSGCSCRD